MQMLGPAIAVWSDLKRTCLTASPARLDNWNVPHPAMYSYALASQKGQKGVGGCKGVEGQGEQVDARKFGGQKGLGAQSASRSQKKMEAEKAWEIKNWSKARKTGG